MAAKKVVTKVVDVTLDVEVDVRYVVSLLVIVPRAVLFAVSKTVVVPLEVPNIVVVWNPVTNVVVV